VSLRALLAPDPQVRAADLGCGDGHLARLLGLNDLVGFDADPEQVAAARARGHRAEEADARSVPRPDSSFDLVVCQALLVHQARPEEVVQEMLRLARPGGRVAAIEPLLPPTTRHPAVTASGELATSALRDAAARQARRTGLGSWGVGRSVAGLLAAHASVDRVISLLHPGLLRVPAASRGTPEQALLRALTRREDVLAELERDVALARADGMAEDQLDAARRHVQSVVDARRAGLRAHTWWETRTHPHVVCVATTRAL